MLTNSRETKRRLEQEGWVLQRVTGSHHVFKHPRRQQTVVLPHPKKDLGPGSFVISIDRLDGNETESGRRCVDEALRNAEEALSLYAEAEAKEGRPLPVPRTLSALKADPAAASDRRDHMVALVALNVAPAHAAE